MFQVTAVINISLYLQRFKGSIASMSQVVPGIAGQVDLELGPETSGEHEQLNPNHLNQEAEVAQATV